MAKNTAGGRHFNTESAKRKATGEEIGVDLTAITRMLQDDGVDKFAHSFDALLDGIREKRDRLRQGQFKPASSPVEK